MSSAPSGLRSRFYLARIWLLVAVVALAMVGVSGLRGAAPVAIILDTDMSGDCDDVGAMAVLHALADRDECRILAVVINRRDLSLASAAAVDVINTFYGRSEIPIGTDKKNPTALQRTSTFTPVLRDEFPHRVGPDDTLPDALEVYRQTLAAQPDGSVTICSIGSLSNLADLLRAEPELVRRKVQRLVIMAGGFPRSAKPETNFVTHLAPAREVVAHWPGEIIWQGDEVGQALITGAALQQVPKHHPIRRAFETRYQFLSHGPAAIERGKPSYDQAAVLYAVRGPEPEFWELVRGGRVRLLDDGNCEWVEDAASAQAYAKINGDPARLAAVIEALMVAPPRAQTENAK